MEKGRTHFLLEIEFGGNVWQCLILQIGDYSLPEFSENHLLTNLDFMWD